MKRLEIIPSFEEPFEGEGTFQIPIVKKQHISLEQLKFIGYDHIKSDERENKDSVSISF